LEKANKEINDVLLKFEKLSNTFDSEKILNTKLITENKEMKIKIKELSKNDDSYKNKIINNYDNLNKINAELNGKLSEICFENKNLKLKNKELYNSSIKYK